MERTFVCEQIPRGMASSHNSIDKDNPGVAQYNPNAIRGYTDVYDSY